MRLQATFALGVYGEPRGDGAVLGRRVHRRAHRFARNVRRAGGPVALRRWPSSRCVAAAFSLERGLAAARPRASGSRVILLGATGVLVFNLCFMYAPRAHSTASRGVAHHGVESRAHAARRVAVPARAPRPATKWSASRWRSSAWPWCSGAAIRCNLLRGGIGLGEIATVRLPAVVGCQHARSRGACSRAMSPLASTTCPRIAGTAMLAVAAAFTGDGRRCRRVVARVWAAIVFIAIFGTAIASRAVLRRRARASAPRARRCSSTWCRCSPSRWACCCWASRWRCRCWSAARSSSPASCFSTGRDRPRRRRRLHRCHALTDEQQARPRHHARLRAGRACAKRGALGSRVALSRARSCARWASSARSAWSCPSAWDGAAMDYVSLALALEEIAAGDGATSTIVERAELRRVRPDPRVRHRRAEGALPAAARARRVARLLLPHRAARRLRCRRHHDARRAPRRRRTC